MPFIVAQSQWMKTLEISRSRMWRACRTKPLSVEDYFGKVAKMLGDKKTQKQYDEILSIDDSEQLSLETVRDCGLIGLSCLVADTFAAKKCRSRYWEANPRDPTCR